MRIYYVLFTTFFLLCSCSCSSKNISTDNPGHLTQEEYVGGYANVVKVSHYKKEKLLKVWLTFKNYKECSIVLKNSSLILLSDYGDEFSSEESYDGPVEEGKEYLYSFKNYPKKIRECLWGEGISCYHEIKITGITTPLIPDTVNVVEGSFYMEKPKEKETSLADGAKSAFSYITAPVKVVGEVLSAPGDVMRAILFIPLGPLAIPMMLGTLK
ncbi:hypothetical protein [Candidatus Uabimicrobium sp. HlEnr_7]|uniref:hypothetical protein n=1 Tax=Candidatus Uabimicrobium helgolandensis TaxID=3095367 RepID=UPI0035564AC7